MIDVTKLCISYVNSGILPVKTSVNSTLQTHVKPLGLPSDEKKQRQQN